MGTSTFQASGSGAQNLASFKAWAEGLHNAILAAGLVQTADTGQINFASITTLPAAGTVAGYAIYRFNDSLQSTAPIFLRVDYATSTASRAAPAFNVGKATNGAGVLDPAVSFGAQRQFILTSGTSSTGAPTYVAVGDGYFCLCFNASTVASGQGGFFIIERHRDSDGNPTGAGVMIAFGGTGSTAATASIIGYRYSDTVAADHQAYLNIPTFTVAQPLGLGVTPLFLIPSIFCPGQTPFQPRTFVAVPPSERPATTFLVPIEGVNHTFVAPLFSTATLVASGFSAAPGATAMLYE